MTRQANGSHTQPLPHKAFGVPAGEQIKKIAMVSRNGGGSIVDETPMEVIFTCRFATSALSVRFLRPELHPAYIPYPSLSNTAAGQQIEACGAASQRADLSLL